MARVDLAAVIHHCNVAWATIRPRLTCSWTMLPSLSSAQLGLLQGKKKNKSSPNVNSPPSLRSPINPNKQPWQGPLITCSPASCFHICHCCFWELLSATKKEIFFFCCPILSSPLRMIRFHFVTQWRVALKHAKMDVVERGLKDETRRRCKLKIRCKQKATREVEVSERVVYCPFCGHQQPLLLFIWQEHHIPVGSGWWSAPVLKTKEMSE